MLREDAVPDQALPNGKHNVATNDENSARRARMAEKARKRTVVALLEETDNNGETSPVSSSPKRCKFSSDHSYAAAPPNVLNSSLWDSMNIILADSSKPETGGSSASRPLNQDSPCNSATRPANLTISDTTKEINSMKVDYSTFTVLIKRLSEMRKEIDALQASEKALKIFFADSPHLFKLIRNKMVDHNISMPKGTVNIKAVAELLLNQSGDFKMCHKISEKTLTVKGCERQQVKPAVQLMSGTVGNALKFLGDQGKLTSSNWRETSEFILLVNKWFDVMNSSPSAPLKLKEAFRSTNEPI